MSNRLRLVVAASAALYAIVSLGQMQVLRPAQVRPGLAVRPEAVPQIRLPSEVERCVQQGGEDCDGDAAKSSLYGGDDCDDGDGNRFPGNVEVADVEGHDEDCDPQTIGNLDLDGDGFIDDRIFNAGGARGTDCDDTRWFIHPGAAELPNKIDDDCDGDVDNLVGEWWSPGGTPPR